MDFVIIAGVILPMTIFFLLSVAEQRSPEPIPAWASWIGSPVVVGVATIVFMMAIGWVVFIEGANPVKFLFTRNRRTRFQYRQPGTVDEVA